MDPAQAVTTSNQFNTKPALVRDAENAYLEWEGEEASPLDDLAGHAITYRIAVGPNRGEKAFTLQTRPAVEPPAGEASPVARIAGFSLHAGVAAKAHQREKLERLCRYICRPAVAEPPCRWPTADISAIH